MLYIHEAKVAISVNTHFPLDMLRYDSCFPGDTPSAINLATVSRATIRNFCIKRYSTNKQPDWTVGRWESFGGVLIENVRTTKVSR